MTVHMEEDFRFTTQVEVDHYTSAELLDRPHLCGFEFGQLLDQLDGQIIAHRQAGRCFRGFVRAPGGTSLWVARHLSDNEADIELVISVEADTADDLLIHELNEMPHVVEAFRNSSDYFREEYAAVIDCSILACRVGLIDWITLVEEDRWLKRKPVVAYAPHRRLSTYEHGHYFMGSSTWVTNGN